MKNKFNFYEVIVTKEDSSQRLDSFLGQTEWIKNRSQASLLIKKSFISIKDKPIKSSYQLKQGDKIQIKIPEEEEEGIIPYAFPVEIVYEDESVIVVNKPSGLVVHPAPGHKGDTLVNALSHKKLSPGSSSLRPGVVHRLDKDTSGILVLAKNKKSEENLIRQFKNRTIKRTYEALTSSFPSELKGTVESYIGRDKFQRQKFTSQAEASPSSKKAITHYSVKKTHESGIALIECVLDTGRTHQIRIHLQSISCSILGDKTYGQKLKSIKSKELLDIIKKLDRVALHAKSLGFKNPLSSKEMFFERPWPLGVRPLLKALQFLE